MLGLFQAADSNGNTNLTVLYTAMDYITVHVISAS